MTRLSGDPQVYLLPGDGIVIARREFLCVLPADAVDAVAGIDRLVRDDAEPDRIPRRGRELVDALATHLASLDREIDIAFAAPDTVGVTLYLRGAGQAESDGRRLRADRGDILDRAVPWPLESLRLFLGDTAPADPDADVFELVEGTVPAAGARLLPPLGTRGTLILRTGEPAAAEPPAPAFVSTPLVGAPQEAAAEPFVSTPLGSSPLGSTPLGGDDDVPGAPLPPAESAPQTPPPPASTPPASTPPSPTPRPDSRGSRRQAPTVIEPLPSAGPPRRPAAPPVSGPHPMPRPATPPRSPVGGRPPAPPLEQRRPLPEAPRHDPAPAVPRPRSAPEVRRPVMVMGIQCVRGHLNHPEAFICGKCGIRMEQATKIPVEGERPALGWLLLDNASTVNLMEPVVIGRAPGAAEAGGPIMLQMADSAGEVSRRHAEIRLVDWDVQLVDLHSRNGTFLTPPGENREFQLEPGRPYVLAPGSYVRLGGRHFIFESSHAVVR